MTARPILFSAPMIRALLAGRKTQTRRTVKPAPDWGTPGPCPSVTPEGWQGPLDYSLWAHEGDQADGESRRCPYGRPGDLLWARETFVPTIAVRAFYRATDEKMLRDDGWAGRWTPSIHMPRRCSRLTLKITDVRIELLQSISSEDAEAEGVQCDHSAWGFVDHYRELWESINGAGSWTANPWVWALSFTVEKRNVDEVLRDAKAAA